MGNKERPPSSDYLNRADAFTEEVRGIFSRYSMIKGFIEDDTAWFIGKLDDSAADHRREGRHDFASDVAFNADLFRRAPYKDIHIELYAQESHEQEITQAASEITLAVKRCRGEMLDPDDISNISRGKYH